MCDDSAHKSMRMAVKKSILRMVGSVKSKNVHGKVGIGSRRLLIELQHQELVREVDDEQIHRRDHVK
jgi:hypothetical protein